ncbi:C4-dicarboxylate TRAP transporter substrate-binding protein [uncultured Oscillibacter sp.]|nr:C4-dicarboxylate TRAP transporter substrate-binding protein [uncultured Oscillibacter sp.]
MKRFLAVLMVGATLFGLTACGSKKEETPPAEGQQQQTPAEPPAAEPIVVQIAYENFPGEPTDLACNEWARLIEEKSGGTMKAEIFHSGQLGSKTDLLDQMQMGEPVITLGDGSFWADYGAPELAITSAPYIYDTWDQAWKLLESDWYDEQVELLAQNGLRVLTANWAYGERNIMTTRPVRSIEDMKGLILRTPNTTSYMRAFEAMGAAPTAMALNDVYTATQQGTIDGMENPMATLYGQSYYEVAKYITLTSHVKMPTQWVCSESFFQSLTPEQQKVLTEAGDEAGLYQNEKQDEMLAQYVADMESNGVEIIELSEEERAKFADAASAIYSDPDVTGAWRDGLYDMVREIMQ